MSVETFIKATRTSAEQTERYLREQQIKQDRLAEAIVWLFDNAVITTSLPTQHLPAFGEAKEMVARAKANRRTLGDVIKFPKGGMS